MAAGGLDGTALRRWLERSDELLAAARSRLDALNVFPVPDADTGTNLAVTIHAAARAAAAPADLAECAMRAADAAARRAQGSSGTILAEYLRGFASGLPPSRRTPPTCAARSPLPPTPPGQPSATRSRARS